MKNSNDTILVEIAAYCDPEVVNTVHSAIIQADNPERIHFAICYQSDNLDDYNELKKVKNCKIKYLKESEARGSVYARYLCQQLIADERFIFQIDSHMRFVKHWDTKLIEQLLSLNDEKAILSVYPPFCTEDMMAKPLDDEIYDYPADGGVMYTNGFRDKNTYFLSSNSIPIKNNDPKAYKRNAFIAGGNFFTFSDAHRVVLHDKDMYFYGDEMPMSIRLFTHGWNVYNPGECYVYHQYERKNQKFPPVTDAMKIENKRLMALLGLEDNDEDVSKFSLGTERTLKEYEEFAGIEFKTKTVYMKAETGDFENPTLGNKLSYLQKKQHDEYSEMNKEEDIEVLIVDLFKDYKECVENCLRKSTNKNNIKFIIATNDQKTATESYIKKNNIKKIIYLKNNEQYTKALSMLTEYMNDCYIALVDSSFRFIEGWDKYYCQNIKLCGDSSALTSWVWLASPETDVENFYNYNNVIKEFSAFYNNLASLQYNEKIDLSKRVVPYQTPFISDGFLFCKSQVLKNVPIDPILTYEEHQYIYSARLFTSGINVYYPAVSYMIRTKEEQLMHGGVPNQNIVCGLMGISNYYSKTLDAEYKYDLGNARKLWEWYDIINVKYDPNNMQIVEDKNKE